LATILFFPYERYVRKIYFLIQETILLRCFAIVKEMEGGGTTYGILYKLIPKVIASEGGLESYTT